MLFSPASQPSVPPSLHGAPHSCFYFPPTYIFASVCVCVCARGCTHWRIHARCPRQSARRLKAFKIDTCTTRTARTTFNYISVHVAQPPIFDPSAHLLGLGLVDLLATHQRDILRGHPGHKGIRLELCVPTAGLSTRKLGAKQRARWHPAVPKFYFRFDDGSIKYCEPPPSKLTCRRCLVTWRPLQCCGVEAGRKKKIKSNIEGRNNER